MDWIEEIKYLMKDIVVEREETLGFMIYFNFIFFITFYYNKNCFNLIKYINFSFQNLLSELEFENQIRIDKIDFLENSKVRAYKFSKFKQKMNDFILNFSLTSDNYFTLFYENIGQKEVEMIRKLMSKGDSYAS